MSFLTIKKLSTDCAVADGVKVFKKGERIVNLGILLP